MDFYVTLSSGPTPDFPNNQSSWSEYYLKDPIELEGEYEVALVQSVFKDVFRNSLDTINILPSNIGMEIHHFEMVANPGEDPETIIHNINKKFSTSFNSPNVPYFKLDKETLEFEIHLPENWHHFIMDIDSYNLIKDSEKLKFRNKKFYHPRHFYVFSSLVDDQVTGNTRHPLLTNFCLPETESNIVAFVPNTPFYTNVKDNLIKDINIQYSSTIYGESNLTGEIISTLHFRKVNGF